MFISEETPSLKISDFLYLIFILGVKKMLLHMHMHV